MKRLSSSVNIALPANWRGIRPVSLREALIQENVSLTDGTDNDRLKVRYILLEAHRQNISSEYLTRWALLDLCDRLSFMDTPPEEPFQLPPLAGKAPIERELHGVPFSDYLQLENLWQGFLSSGAPEALTKMSELIWKGQTQFVPADLYLVILWYSGLKAHFAVMFSSLFRPAGNNTDIDMRRIMTAEIRALTGGDITKENAVLAADTWTALTELDAKACEAEEWRSKYKS